MDFKKVKFIYFVGIKGVAMTALAIVAKEMRIKVTGSDLREKFVTDPVLKRNKINWLVGFKKENIEGLKRKPDLVVVTGAHGGMTHPEAVAAKKMGLEVVMHGQALGLFMKDHQEISVAGCHGKTTTAAMTATILTKGGLGPSFAIGCGDIPVLGNPGHMGKGEYFVAEADEYATCPATCKTPRFMWQNPEIAVFTNVEFDHPDFFLNLENVKQAFLNFALKIPKNGLLVAGIDNQTVRQILPEVNCQVLTFGRSPLAEFQMNKVYFGRERTWFWLKHKGVDLGEFVLKVPGVHNALNAAAAAIVGNYLGISWSKIKASLKAFTGTKRRFEKIGQVQGISLYDDYAHHPTEIAATLKAARAWFPKRRIICLFQPHTFSRTKALFNEFARCFKEADLVVIADIYSSAREKDDLGVSSRLLASEIKKMQPRVFYKKGKEETIRFLRKSVLPADLILTMGAGDIFTWHEDILEVLESS